MFQILDGREHFYQWDIDRKIIVLDDDITEVHFCNRTDDCSLVCEVYSIDGIRLVNVPNILLQNDWRINVYAYDKNYTKHSECFKVVKRSKPTDYIYTETEIKRYGDLEERIAALEENGIPSDVDLTGYATEKYVDKAIENIELTPGPAGPQGPKGEDGAQGEQGPKGDKGDKGDTGPAGPQGEKGADGAQGIQGPAGKDGAKGDKGDTGEQGPQGIQGPKGDTGATGPQGPKGDTGATGPAGKDGADGKDGATGPQGEKGEKGDKGDTGAQGPQGEVGPKGDKGDKGDTGAKGANGYTPIKGTDYYTEDDKAEMTDYIASELAKRGQLKPEFANSVGECTDTTKLYVLPDGYIYAYMKSGGYTNQVPISIDKDGTVFNGVGYQDNHRLDYSTSGDTTAELANHVATGYIPMVHTDTIRMSGVTWGKTNKNCIAFFDENFMPMGSYIGNGYVNGAPASVTGKGKTVSCLGDKTLQSVAVEDGVSTFTITFLDTDKEASSIINYSGDHVKYVRISAEGSGANMAVTINEEIVGSPEGEYAWKNTGHAFVPMNSDDYVLKEEFNELLKANDSSKKSSYTFDGKKVMFFGDSITRNESSYIQNLLDRTGMIRVVNFAIDGAKLRNKGDTQMDGNPSFEANNTVPNQVQKLLNNIADYEVPDIIIVSAGTNDDSAEDAYNESKYTDDTGAYVEVDTISLTDFSGAMRWIYEKLIGCYPDARIFFATPIQANYGSSRTFARTRTKAECIRQNCERLSVPCIDAFKKSGIYSRYEVQSANGKYLKDGLHPNSAGAVVLARCYHRELANALID